jgi:hypothetical protein
VTTTPVSYADFGPLVIATDIDDAIIATLRRWLPTYLWYVEQERGITHGSLPRPVAASFANTLSDDEFPDHILPAIMVTTAGTTEATILADGMYTATFLTTISCVLRGQKPPETRHSASLYEGCIRRALVQNGSLGGAVAKTKYVPTNPMVGPVADRKRAGRYLAAGMARFHVYVDQIVQQGVGPILPDAEPYDALAIVSDVTTVVDGESISESP